MATNHDPLGGYPVDPGRPYWLLAANDRPLYVSLPVPMEGRLEAESFVFLAIVETEAEAQRIAAAYTQQLQPVLCDPTAWRDCWAPEGRSVGAVLLDACRMPRAIHWVKGHGECAR